MREALNTSATIAGTCTFIAQVSGTLPVAPNLRPAMNTTLAALRQLLERGAIQQVGGDRLDACLDQRLAHAGLAEARDAHHPLGRRGALGQARQGRAHLAADAQHDDVAGRLGEIGDQRVGRRGHEILDGLDAFETCGECHVEAPLAIGFIDLKSMSAPTAKPGTSSEPSASLPPRALRRAGLPSCFS